MDKKYSGWMCYKNSTRWVWDETKWNREVKVKGNEGKNRWDDRFQIWLVIMMI